MVGDLIVQQEDVFAVSGFDFPRKRQMLAEKDRLLHHAAQRDLGDVGVVGADRKFLGRRVGDPPVQAVALAAVFTGRTDILQTAGG